MKNLSRSYSINVAQSELTYEWLIIKCVLFNFWLTQKIMERNVVYIMLIFILESNYRNFAVFCYNFSMAEAIAISFDTQIDTVMQHNIMP